MLEPYLRPRPRPTGKKWGASQVKCMPRMKKHCAHAPLAVGVSLEPTLAHEIRTIAVCFLNFFMDIAHHGPNRQ